MAGPSPHTAVPPDPRSCTGACSVKTASPWTTSGRLSGVGSPQIQVTGWPGAAPPSQGLRALALPARTKDSEAKPHLPLLHVGSVHLLPGAALARKQECLQ